jgi:PDZ domain-containing protein
MRRRGWTVLIGTVLVAGLTFAALWIPVPYVSLGPGPTVDTLGKSGGKQIITVQKGTAYQPNGQLRLVTVSVTTGLDLGSALYYWISSDYAVVPTDAVYPPNQSQEQTDKQEQQQFQDSQSAAETAALHQLGCATVVTVASIDDGAPADGKLKPGDGITSVNGKAVTSSDQLVTLVQGGQPGTVETIGYLRDGKAGSVAVTTGKGSNGKAKLGIGTGLGINPTTCPYRVKVSLGDIGGPSAGLMFALGIVDTLTPGDLTGGKVVAGTGEIEPTGKVDPIGGIQEKMIAAKRDRAKYFLSPADNCKDAKAAVPSGLTLAKVATLKDALTALDDIRTGKTPPPC